MERKKTVIFQTRILAAGEMLCAGVILGIYWLLGRLNRAVVLGILMGAVLAVGNFLFMALTADLASDRAAKQDVQGGQLLIRNSYLLRLAGLFGILFLCAKSGWFDLVALVLPILFVSPILIAVELFRKAGSL